MVNAQQWLDNNYPLNGTCQRKEKKDLQGNIINDENYGKIRKWIIKLNISYKNLTGELNLAGFTNLTQLICYNNQLTNLNLSNCSNLTELSCSNNQLADINLPPDAVLLEKVNIEGNEHLNYEQIDSKFLKYLPTLTNYEIVAISEEFTNLIKEKLHNVDIQTIEIVSTWWNPNCALVTSKVMKYAVRLIIYEPATKETPEIFKTIRFPNNNPLVGYKNFEKVQKKITELKEQLNSDNPILAIFLDTSFSPEEIIKKFELPKEAKTNPDQFLQPMDMIWRNMKGLSTAYHVAVYLGNKRVAHIGSSKFAKLQISSASSKIIDKMNPSNPSNVSNASSDKALMGARNDHWNDFLHGNTSKLVRHHLIIPFKRPELIQQHLISAVVGNYGAKNYNLFHLNCEHFATLCVTGIPFSTQADKFVITKHFESAKDLATVLQTCEQQILNEITIPAEELANKIDETKNKFIANRQERLKVLQNKVELTTEGQQSLTQFQLEITSLVETIAQIQIPPKN